MKQAYFSGADTEDEDSLKDVGNYTRIEAYDPNNVDMDLFIIVDKASQVTEEELSRKMKALLEGIGEEPNVDPDSGNIIVSNIPQGKRFLTRFARFFNRLFQFHSIGDFDMIIKTQTGDTIYDVCITPKCPFDADGFVNSISAKCSDLRCKTMGITLSKEPLDIFFQRKGKDIAGEVLGTGSKKTSAREHEDDLKILFPEDSNWIIVQSYDDIKNNGMNSAPIQAVVYEALPYITEKGVFLVETERLLDKAKLYSLSETTPIIIFAIYDTNDIQAYPTNESSMKFLGIYQLDKGKSLAENHLSFRLMKDDWNTRIRSTHHRHQ
jgi:hypothetical protein